MIHSISPSRRVRALTPVRRRSSSSRGSVPSGSARSMACAHSRRTSRSDSAGVTSTRIRSIAASSSVSMVPEMVSSVSARMRTLAAIIVPEPIASASAGNRAGNTSPCRLTRGAPAAPTAHQVPASTGSMPAVRATRSSGDFSPCRRDRPSSPAERTATSCASSAPRASTARRSSPTVASEASSVGIRGQTGMAHPRPQRQVPRCGREENARVPQESRIGCRWHEHVQYINIRTFVLVFLRNLRLDKLAPRARCPTADEPATN